MTISAISSGNMQLPQGSNPIAQMKKSFDELGNALKSGNIEDAEKAFSKLQSSAPSQAGDGKNPMSSEITSLKKALDSGDLKGAQAAYSKIEEKISKAPNAGGPPQGAAGAKNGKAGSAASGGKTYDKKDTNKDGTVSLMEEMAYALTHASSESKASPTVVDEKQKQTGVETYA